jgi:hypothetical protein
MMLLPPAESLEDYDGDNPYLFLGGLGQALAVLTERLNSQEQQERLASDDDVDYGVTGDTTAGAAFLEITTQTAEEEDALRLLDEVSAAAAQQLEAMQGELEVEGGSAIGIMLVTADIEATPLTSTRMQLTVAVGAAGAVLTIILAAMIEGLAAARSRRKAAANAPAPRERDLLEPLRANEVLHQDESPLNDHGRRTPREARRAARAAKKAAKRAAKAGDAPLPADETGGDSAPASDAPSADEPASAEGLGDHGQDEGRGRGDEGSDGEPRSGEESDAARADEVLSDEHRR